jgi:cell wall-associated NlpC family hydrolase
MTAIRLRVAVPSAFLRGRPDASAEALTELLYGEEVTVSFRRADWAEVESRTDFQRGFIPADALAEPGPDPTHRVWAIRSFVFPEANLKVPPIASLSFLSPVRPGALRHGFAELADGGWIFAAHLASRDAVEADYARTALRFLEIPYLWGGRTSLGLDCSALVQLSLAAAGLAAPRDSGPQRAQLGHLVLGDAPPRPRDLVFWPGHVGIMVDGETMVHANAHHMAVTLEPLAAVSLRAGALPEVRRL